MSSLRAATVLFSALTLTSAGCHGRYRRAAPDIGSAKLDVVIAAQPTIAGADLSSMEAPETAADVVTLGTEIATAALAVKVATILNKAVDPEAVEGALTKGIVEKAERRPPPYSVSEKKGKADLEITITGYGLSVSGGVPAVWLTTSSAIYERDGDRVYRASERCETELPTLLPIALPGQVGELQAMASLAELKPAQLEALLGALAETCGKKVAKELVQHAK